jgi:hypothetical protein
VQPLNPPNLKILIVVVGCTQSPSLEKGLAYFPAYSSRKEINTGLARFVFPADLENDIIFILADIFRYSKMVFAMHR